MGFCVGGLLGLDDGVDVGELVLGVAVDGSLLGLVVGLDEGCDVVGDRVVGEEVVGVVVG